ncbi:MAG: hypothetical protein R3F62_04655 [Planctomycetota bacterium]
MPGVAEGRRTGWGPAPRGRAAPGRGARCPGSAGPGARGLPGPRPLRAQARGRGVQRDEPAPPPERGDRQRGSSGRQRGTSGRQRGSSGRQRGTSSRKGRVSGTGRAASARGRAEPEPEYEADYASPRRGGGGGFASIAQSPQIQSAIKGVVALAAIGALGYFVYGKLNEDKRPTFKKPPTVATNTPPDKPTTPETTDPTPKPETPEQPTEPTPVDAFIPEGALAARFEAVRDANDGFEVDAALRELAAADGGAAAAAEALEKSTEARYKERMEQVLFRSGEPAARWERIQKALKGTDANQALHAARAALDLELPEVQETLDKLDARGQSLTAAVWLAAVKEVAPEDRFIPLLESNLKRLDALGNKLIEPVLLWGGKSDYLLATAPWLDAQDERMLSLARRALSFASGGSGPGEDASAEAWKAWAEGQGTAREIYLRASSELDLPAAYAARVELAAKGPAALDYLPLFIRERASSPEKLGLMSMAAGLVRRFGTGEAQRVEPVLETLTKVFATSHGDWVIGAALAADDAEIAWPAVKAMQRGACAQGQAEDLPALCGTPDELATGGVSGLPDTPSGRMMLRALFRDEGVREGLLRGSPADDKRRRAAALVAGEELDASLREVLESEAYPQSWSREHVIAFFMEAGTERSAEFAEELLIAAGGTNEARLFTALATPASTKKLEKHIANDNGQLRHMLALGEVVGDELTSAVSKRAKPGDPFEDAAKQALMRYGDGRKSVGFAREIAEAYLATPAANNRLAAPKDYVFWALSNSGSKTDLKLFADCFERGLPRVRPADQPTLFAAACPHVGEDEIAELMRGNLLPGKLERGLAAGALAGYVGDVPNLEEIAGSLAGLAQAEPPTEHDMVAFAALGVVSPKAAAEAAGEVFEHMKSPRAVAPTSQIGFAVGMTLAGKHDELREYTYLRSTNREYVARGIAIAAQRRGATATAPPVLQELLLDGDPRVHAEAAVAAAFFKLDGALREIGCALGAPQEYLDNRHRTGPEFALLTLGREEPQTLRAALWDAYAWVTGEEIPVLLPRWSLARGVQGSFEMRRKALGK